MFFFFLLMSFLVDKPVGKCIFSRHISFILYQSYDKTEDLISCFNSFMIIYMSNIRT